MRLSRFRGFSLVELAVVLAVISILAAIAVPVFLGQLDRSANVAAQSALLSVQAEVRSVLNQPPIPEADEAFEVFEPRFAFPDPAEWPPLPPYVVLAGSPSDGSERVSAAVRDPDSDSKVLVLAALVPRTSLCWAVLDVLDEPLRFGVFSVPDGVVSCNASLLPLGGFSASSFPPAP